MLDLSPRRSVLTFRDFVGGDSVNIVVLLLEKQTSLDAAHALESHDRRFRNWLHCPARLARKEQVRATTE